MSKYIDADKLRTRLMNADYGGDMFKPPISDVLEVVVFEILKIPLADVRDSRGEWLGGKNYNKCSVCGGFELGATRYCPHCGAKMKGWKEE